jgi:hypothetical protein
MIRRPARSRRPRDPMRYESHGEPVASLATFRRRLLANARLAASVVAFSLALGVAGYHWIVGVPDWLDSLLAASMILGGMGPIGDLPATPAGKIFAAFYALYCGVVLLVTVGLLLTPAVHRLLHRFHMATDEEEAEVEKKEGPR